MSESQQEQEYQLQRSQRRWRVRRRLAVVSFVLITAEIIAPFVLIGFGLIEANMLTALAAYLGAPTVGLFSIIGLYIGFSTKDDLKIAEIASAAK